MDKSWWEKNELVCNLRARYNRPVRPFLRNAMAVLNDVSDPLRGWIMLAERGLLPEDFARDGHRRYARILEGESHRASSRPYELDYPSTLTAVLTIASDPHGVLLAESHAREFASRLKAWSAVCDDRVCWYFIDASLDYVVFLGAPYESARDTLENSLGDYGIDVSKLIPKKGEIELNFLVRRAIGAWRGWRIADENNFEITSPSWPLDTTKWRRFSDLANPFEPLLLLWQTGYQLVCPLTEKDPSIRLYVSLLNSDPVSAV